MLYIYYSSFEEYLYAPFLYLTVFMGQFLYDNCLHGFHVIIGTLFILVCLLDLEDVIYQNTPFGFEFSAWYWHFVDVVWLFVYLSIYWWVVFKLFVIKLFRKQI
jgi:cytochrome c oxidase subunit 3